MSLLRQANIFRHAKCLQVTGDNLVPMTLQKQNVVTAVIADVLTPSAVFYINCTAVNQVSAAPGRNSSTAVVSLVLQQDADAVYIGHVTFLTLPCNFLPPSPSQPHHLSLCRPSPARPPHKATSSSVCSLQQLCLSISSAMSASSAAMQLVY